MIEASLELTHTCPDVIALGDKVFRQKGDERVRWRFYVSRLWACSGRECNGTHQFPRSQGAGIQGAGVVMGA